MSQLPAATEGEAIEAKKGKACGGRTLYVGYVLGWDNPGDHGNAVEAYWWLVDGNAEEAYWCLVD